MDQDQGLFSPCLDALDAIFFIESTTVGRLELPALYPGSVKSTRTNFDAPGSKGPSLSKLGRPKSAAKRIGGWKSESPWPMRTAIAWGSASRD